MNEAIFRDFNLLNTILIPSYRQAHAHVAKVFYICMSILLRDLKYGV